MKEANKKRGDKEKAGKRFGKSAMEKVKNRGKFILKATKENNWKPLNRIIQTVSGQPSEVEVP